MPEHGTEERPRQESSFLLPRAIAMMTLTPFIFPGSNADEQKDDQPHPEDKKNF